jgi:hypothetical protein
MLVTCYIMGFTALHDSQDTNRVVFIINIVKYPGISQF